MRADVRSASRSAYRPKVYVSQIELPNDGLHLHFNAAVRREDDRDGVPGFQWTLQSLEHVAPNVFI